MVNRGWEYVIVLMVNDIEEQKKPFVLSMVNRGWEYVIVLMVNDIGQQ